MDNLDKMCCYARTKNECRRVLVLNYLGEQFDDRQCKQYRLTACDNCSSNVSIVLLVMTEYNFRLLECQAKYETRDVTEDATKIVRCVQYLTDEGKGSAKGFTVNYLCDVLRGNVSKPTFIAKCFALQGHSKRRS